MRTAYTGLLLLLTLFLASCDNTATVETADTILYNGNIVTLEDDQPTAQAIAIRDGKILQIGTDEAIKQLADDATEQIDLQGQFTMPGFIEGHGHFSSLGQSLMILNFLRSDNWDQIVGQVEEAAKSAKPGEWIIGRGWHQEKWNEELDKNVYGYPYHDKLSKISPNNPVLLRHASGHGLFANKKAMELAGVTKETPDPKGGRIVRAPNGEPIGVFEETAMKPIRAAYKEYTKGLDEEAQLAEWYKAIELVEEECLKKGITSFQDAGSSYDEITRYTKLAEEGKLDLRLWAMLRHPYDTMKDRMNGFPIIGAGNDFFTCRSVKAAIDGALGSYGAWLLEPYNDKPDFHGQNTTSLEEIDNIAKLCDKNGMQFCVHAIGDRGNREVLDIYAKYLNSEAGKAKRWRIEHAQHVNLADIPRFPKLGVIASMQGVHCTSDAPYVPKRLGERRAKEEAYPWRSFIEVGAVVTNGTDAPVEDVSAIESYYASVTRRPRGSETAFVPEQKMTRIEGLKTYTLNCAYAAFEEDIKGSLKVGKVADIVVLSNDLLKVADDEILNTDVIYTIVGGKVKYQLIRK